MVRLLYLEDHLVLREALGTVLEQSGRFQIVGQASTAREALALVELTSPEVVLADLSLAEASEDGAWFVHELRQRGHKTPVLVLSMHDDEELVARAFAAGANGYLIKTASNLEVLTAIGQVLAGATYIHPGVASGVVRQLRRALSQDGLLSEREHELLCLAARGLSNPQIAREMVLSQNTVKTHLQAIYRKLGVRDRNEAVLEAVERKLLPESALRRGRPRG